MSSATHRGLNGLVPGTRSDFRTARCRAHTAEYRVVGAVQPPYSSRSARSSTQAVSRRGLTVLANYTGGGDVAKPRSATGAFAAWARTDGDLS
jgi:hypothetical protein